jgi:hypothetical protein
LDESYPGIQPTTARKAGDLLTVTDQGQGTVIDGQRALRKFIGQLGQRAAKKT